MVTSPFKTHVHVQIAVMESTPFCGVGLGTRQQQLTQITITVQNVMESSSGYLVLMQKYTA